MPDSMSGDAAASPVGPGGSAVPGPVAEPLERAEDRLAVPLPGDDRPVPLPRPHVGACRPESMATGRVMSRATWRSLTA